MTQAVRSFLLALGRRLGRALLLLALVMAGTILLVRVAPGYFVDASEMDAIHGQSARARESQAQLREGSMLTSMRRTAGALLHGDLGDSRQYGLPVSTLLRPRLAVTGRLLASGIVAGWLLALAGATVATSGREQRVIPGAIFTVLLAVPTAAMATICLVSERGGPVVVLALVVAARDYPFLKRLLREAWTSSAALHARAAGLRPWQIGRAHVGASVLPQLRALATLSLVTALSALLPVEVLFDLPGVAQLAWNAAGNRDLPVLLAVTLLMAGTVAAASVLAEPTRTPDLA